MQGVAGGWSYERVSDFVGFHLWKMLMMMFSSGVGAFLAGSGFTTHEWMSIC